MMNEETIRGMDAMHTMMLEESEGDVFFGTSSVIGRRSEQQDAIRVDDSYAYGESGKAIAVLCDGMGGLAGGAKASNLCACMVFDAFHSDAPLSSFQDFYRRVVCRADEEVSGMRTEGGTQLLGAGTTLVSVAIQDGQLHWASVGDSRIYIIRGSQIRCVTHDHNYLMLLSEKVKRGEMTQQEADTHPKREALISYVGMGGVAYLGLNTKPFQLLDGDMLVLCSDGLYRSVSEEEIRQVVRCFADDVQQAAEALTSWAMSKSLPNQDNTSVVVVSYRKTG